MRLTLRTMLAYLDEILEPADAEDIGKKIEESELAKTVMQRTRDSMRRLRLGAPALSGRGIAADPNSVAEYLDNTLPPEQVPEFERVCLESDVHLAEVGACHQILTLVLGEPAEVDPDSKERMYQVISQASGPAVASTPVVVQAPPVSMPAKIQPIKRPKPEVPEYLREGRSSSWTTAAAILILALLGGGIAATMLSPQLREQAAAFWKKGTMHPDDLAADNGMAPPVPELPVIDEGAYPGENTDTQSPESDDAGDTPDLAGPAGGPGMRPEFERSQQDVDEGAMPPEPDQMEVDELSEGPPDPATMAGDDTAMPDEPAPGAVPAPGTVAATKSPAAEAPPTPEIEPAASEAVGRFMNKQDALLRYDRGARNWRRVSTTSGLLAAGDQLMSLPLFRPQIALGTGVTIQPVDAAHFELLGIDDSGVPGIALEYGRLMLFTVGKPRNQIRVQLGDRQGLITFGDGESTMALEAQRSLVLGSDPAEAPGPLAIELYATSGDITWRDEAGVLPLRAPAHKTLTTVSVEPAGPDLPKWTRGEPLSQVDHRAATALEHDLSPERPITLSLKELSENRRVEVRSLAIRAAANMGDFEPFVRSLNDPDQRMAWTSHIDTLRLALARGPETAQKVLAAFEKLRGTDGAELYRMLWGYTPEQLSSGAAAKLVDHLNNDALDYRVLAFHNLHQITGMSLYYRPEYPAAKRKKEFAKWKEKLKEGKIVPMSTPAPPRSVGAKPPARPAAEAGAEPAAAGG